MPSVGCEAILGEPIRRGRDGDRQALLGVVGRRLRVLLHLGVAVRQCRLADFANDLFDLVGDLGGRGNYVEVRLAQKV